MPMTGPPGRNTVPGMETVTRPAVAVTARPKIYGSGETAVRALDDASLTVSTDGDASLRAYDVVSPTTPAATSTSNAAQLIFSPVMARCTGQAYGLPALYAHSSNRVA